MNGRSVSGLTALVGISALAIVTSPDCLAAGRGGAGAAPASSRGAGFSTGSFRAAPGASFGLNGGMSGAMMAPRFSGWGGSAPMMSVRGAGPGAGARMPMNQWATNPSVVPNTMPALNSNTSPAMNSNTMPALNNNTMPLLNPPVNQFPTGPGWIPPTTPVSPISPITPPGVWPGPGGPGNGPNCPLPPPNPGCPVFCPPGWNWWPWGSGGTALWNGTNFVLFWNGWPVPAYVPGPFGGQTFLYDENLLPGASRQPVNTQANQPPPQPSPFEIGVAAFRAGNTQAAVQILNNVVAADKEDTIAMRILALALLEQREPDNAAAMMRQAYRMDPTLASRVLEVDALALTSSRRTSLINRAVEYANRVGSASGWLTVAVLMQADGRFELARRMLKRAADEGLEPDVRKAFEAAISARVPQSPQRPVRPVARPVSQPTSQPAPATPANTAPADMSAPADGAK